MTKYKIIFVIFLCFIRTSSVCCQTTDSTENISDTAVHFVTTLNQTVNPESIREVPDQQIARYLKNPDYAYANDSTYWKNDPPERQGILSKFLLSKTFGWIFFICMVTVVLFGLYRIALENNFNWFFGHGGKSLKAGNVTSSADNRLDFDMLIEKHQSQGDYRTAIRYLYLRLIKTAAKNKHFQIGESSTNAAIARAFSNQRDSADFRFLANIFEHVFYGGFSPDYPLYKNIKNRFDQFQESVLS